MAEFYTIDQYANRVGVSPSVVYHWIHNNGLKATDVSKNPNTGNPRWRISPEAAQEFEQSRTRQAVPPAPKPKRRARKVDNMFTKRGTNQ